MMVYDQITLTKKDFSTFPPFFVEKTRKNLEKSKKNLEKRGKYRGMTSPTLFPGLRPPPHVSRIRPKVLRIRPKELRIRPKVLWIRPKVLWIPLQVFCGSVQCVTDPSQRFYIYFVYYYYYIFGGNSNFPYFVFFGGGATQTKSREEN